ncbi:MAG: 4Fe-4S binding protein [Candidatus Thermoplasmatota archaeon]
MKREIIKIDHEICDGCGECVKGCPEGALQVIDGKARLINEAFCDGLGACIGDCPKDAIEIIEREAEPYDEKTVVKNIAEQGENVLKAHLEHLKEHDQTDLLNEAVEHLEELGIDNPIEMKEEKEEEGHTCPGSAVGQWENEGEEEEGRLSSRLQQWPVQLNLVPVQAPFFDDKELVIAADCVPFAYPNFHPDFLEDSSLIIGCPKLDDAEHYVEKLTEIFKQNEIKRLKVVHMEVPCCFGLKKMVKKALSESGKEIPIEDITISVKGKEK